MELPIELLDQIEQYLNHQLPDGQRREIESRMEKDRQFRETVEAMRQSRTIIDEATQASLIRMARSVMTQLDQQATQPAPAKTQSARPRNTAVFWRYAMAVIVLLIGGVFALLTGTVELANADLDAGVHRDATKMVTSQDLRPAERQALDDFLTANALYTKGDFSNAVKLYERAVSAPISAYLKESIWWNLCLTYMKTGDLDKAQQYWQQYEVLDKPHYPSTFLDRSRIRARLFFGALFD